MVRKAIIKKFNLKPWVNMPWCTSKRYDRYTLGELLGEIGFNIGAEIGVRRGNYSKYLCEKNHNLKLYCIDPWLPHGNKYTVERQERYYQETLKNTNGLNIEIIRKKSHDALNDIPDRSLDFVFVDGDHSFDHCVTDIIFWSKKVKKGGLIIVHDCYGWSGGGVLPAVYGYTYSHNLEWFITKEAEPTAFWINQ